MIDKMNKIQILSILSILSISGPSLLAADLRPLFEAIREVETGGEKNPSTAVGDHGCSVGPYQIGRLYHQDAWRTRRGYARVREREYAERTMVGYWRRYDPQALEGGDFEKLARLHNGGCNLWKSKAAGRYWAKVQVVMRSKP